ncbi:MAG: type IV toxin-antitoxin system AbiEi family antitoxin domain-containing protein, partial [Nitrososphaeraceae archaeon]
MTLEERELSVFTKDDAKIILNTTDSSVWHVLNGLVHKKRIRRIERGRYLLIPAKAGVDGNWSEYPWAILSHLIDIYYVGFWTAMNYWDMTEQIPYTIFVATTKRKRNLTFDNQKFQFITLSEKKFFGFIEET